MQLESLLRDHLEGDGYSPLEAYKACFSVLVRSQLLWKTVGRPSPSLTPGDVNTSTTLNREGRSNPLGPLIQVTVNSKVVTPISRSPHSKPSNNKETVSGVRQTVVKLADRIATHNLSLGGESLVKGKQFVYLLTPYVVPLQLDTNKTLGKVLLGSLGVKLNTFYRRNLWFAISLAVLWFLGLIVSFLSMISVVPHYLAWTGILTLPAQVFTSSLVQYDIVIDLFRRFSSRYCFGNIIVGTTSLVWLFQGDIRSIVPVVVAASLTCSLFIDALPPKLRAGSMAPTMIIGLFWLLSLQACLFFNLFDVRPQQLNLGSVVITASSTLTSSLANLSIYVIKNLYTTVMHHHRYAVKTSRMILQRLEKSEADDIQALDYILHQKIIHHEKKASSLVVLKVMEIESSIQEILIHLVESLHSSDIDNKDDINVKAPEVIDIYLQSKLKTTRDLIKKERASDYSKGASSSSNSSRYRPTVLSRADELESIASASLGSLSDGESSTTAGGIYLAYALLPSRIIQFGFDKEIGEVYFRSYGRHICEWWINSPLVQQLFIFSSAVSIILSLLVCADLLPWWILLLLGITLVPVSFFIGLTLQSELCRLLVFRFETMLGLLFILQTTLGLSWTFNNFKMMAPSFMAPWFLVLLFSDAMGPDGRIRIAKFVIPLGIFWCFGMFLSIYFNWFPGVESQTVQALGLRFTSTSTACGGLIQMMILSIKNMYTTLHYENSLAVIHSPMETVKVNKRLADLIIAGKLACDKAIQQRIMKVS